MNWVPKEWAEKDTYHQLYDNDEADNPYYAIKPRIGAFEVSTVYKNEDILFYSKLT